MNFLADESCDFLIVRALRTAGFDVEAISETFSGAEDTEVLHRAFLKKRIFLTEDKDFGQLVFSHHQKTTGVIFLRYPASLRQRISLEVVKIAKDRGDKLIGSFVVIQPGRIRIIKTQD